MARTAKTAGNLLIPSPKDLDSALALSADHAQRMAQAFGLKVPGIVEKPGKLNDLKRKLNMPMTEKQLLARDAKRDIGAELLLAARQLREGKG